VLEIGTFRGYSGIWIALGLEQTGGRLTTIDIDPERVKESRGNFEKAGLADRITNLEGDAHQLAKTVDGPFDMVFLDADKGREVDYFNTLFPSCDPRLPAAAQRHHVEEGHAAVLRLVSKNPEIIHVILSLSMKGTGFP